MYEIVKGVLLKMLPLNFIIKNEMFLRKIWSVFYFGKNHKCNVCASGLKSFLKSNDDLICPVCGSLCRDRRLWDILSNNYLTNNISILDFSPSRSIYRKHKQGNYSYKSSVLGEGFISDVKYNITDIPETDNEFDLIICYHILEHVIDDAKAIAELYRILKSEGVCIIQTPFKSGDIYEDYSITSEEERKIHFGQEDHVRMYSVDGLIGRLQKFRFNVSPLNFGEKENNKNGFNTSETVLICKKTE